jgi:hypothetical protein
MELQIVSPALKGSRQKFNMPSAFAWRASKCGFPWLSLCPFRAPTNLVAKTKLIQFEHAVVPESLRLSFLPSIFAVQHVPSLSPFAVETSFCFSASQTDAIDFAFV